MKHFGAIALALAVSTATPAAAQQNMFGPGMHAVKMAVDDFQKSTQFYVALGMKPGATYGATRELVWESGSKNSGILMAGPAYPGRKDIVRGGNYLMIVTPDIKAAADRLTRAGFPVGKIGGGAQASLLMVKDPDGNQIELMGPPLPK
jgi:catechol 2,3-dioxygenase-like lactoylglutathione lyase family enzyme